MRTFLISLTVAVALALLVGVFLYAGGPMLAQYIGIYQLEKSGAENITLEIERPDLNGIVLNSFKASWQGFDITARNVRLSYDVATLLTGKADSISIQQLDISASTKPGVSSADSDATYTLRPSISWSDIEAESPINHISVDLFTYQDAQQTLQGSLQLSRSKLRVDGKLSNALMDEALDFSVDLNAQNQLLVVVSELDKPTELLNLSAHLQSIDANQVQLEADFSVSAKLLKQSTYFSSKGFSVLDNGGSLSARFILNAPLNNGQELKLDALTASGTLNIDLHLVEVNNPTLKLSTDSKFTASFVDNTFTLQPINDADFHVHIPENMAITWGKEATLTAAGTTLEMTSGIKMHYANVEYEVDILFDEISALLNKDYTVAEAHASLQPNASFRLKSGNTLPEASLKFQAAHLQTISRSTFSYLADQAELRIEPLDLELGITKLTYLDTAYQAKELTLNTQKITYQLGEALKFTLLLSNLDSSFKANIQAEYEIDTVDIQARAEIHSQTSFANSFFSDWPHEWDGSGKIQLEALARINVHNTELSSLSGDIVAEALNIQYADMHINAFDVAGPFSLLPSGPEKTLLDRLESKAIKLSIAEADLGIILNNLQAKLSIQSGSMQLNSVVTEILGGSMSIAPFTFKLSAPLAETKVTFSDLHLSELIALVDEETSATGKLNGEILLSTYPLKNPPKKNEQVFEIEKGLLQSSSAGGKIEYHIDAESLNYAKQSGFDFALAALADFNYEKLESSVRLKADGNLHLGVSLLGRNPEVQNGRAIQYNLNIDQNVFDLLRSLRLGDKISARVGDNVRN